MISGKDIEMKMEGEMHNFKLFDNGSKDTPVYALEIINFKNIQLKVFAKTAQIVYNDASRELAFTQLQIEAIMPKATKKLDSLHVSGLALYGKNCFNMPSSSDMVATLTKSAVKGELQPTLGVSE